MVTLLHALFFYFGLWTYLILTVITQKKEFQVFFVGFLLTVQTTLVSVLAI